MTTAQKVEKANKLLSSGNYRIMEACEKAGVSYQTFRNYQKKTATESVASFATEMLNKKVLTAPATTIPLEGRIWLSQDFTTEEKVQLTKAL